MGGSYSQIEAELQLFESVLSAGERYARIHLLSGQDLPLQSQDAIHAYFDSHPTEEFIRFQNEELLQGARVHYWWFFQDRVGRARRSPLGLMQRGLVATQKILHIQRNRSVSFQKGDNWCSITEALVRHIVSQREWIRKTFAHSVFGDEMFVQTIVINSSFCRRLHWSQFDDDERAFMRRIAWSGGNAASPGVWRLADVDGLLASGMMFARKFDSAVDPAAVREVSRRVGAKS